MTIQQTVVNRLRAAGVTESIFVGLEYYSSSNEETRETLHWEISIVNTQKVVVAERHAECILDALDAVIGAYNSQKVQA